jgi:hypothetical protein
MTAYCSLLDVTSHSLVWDMVVWQEMLLLLTYKNVFDFDGMNRAIFARKMYRLNVLLTGHHSISV